MLLRALSLVAFLSVSLLAPSPPLASPGRQEIGNDAGAPVRPGELLEEARRQRSANRPDAALAVLDTLLKTFPAYPPANLERAEILLELGRLSGMALADAKVAAEAFPEEPRAALALSLAAAESGDLDLAIEALRRALAVQGKPDAALLRRRAGLLVRAGREEEAVRAWEALRDLEPGDPSPRVELAQLYEKVGRIASARKEHEAVLEALPTNAPLRRRYADFLERQGRLGKAKAMRAEADRIAGVSQRKLRALPPSKN